VNKKQFFTRSQLGVDYLALNHDPGHAFHNNPQLAKAVNYAVDRRAYTAQRGAFGGSQTNRILPPGINGVTKKTQVLPGYPTKAISRADIAKAKALAAGHTQGGKLEGQQLKKAVVPLLKGSWKGDKVVVIGFSAKGCEPCDQRVQGAFDEIKTFLPKAKYLFLRDVADNVNAAQVRMTDLITAYPGYDFVVAALDDETGGGAFNAIRQAKIESKARLATLGGDNLAIANILKHSPAYVASIDAKPFCEAWNWVEAALAVKDGKTFSPYPFTGVITSANVAKYKWRLKIKF